MIADPLTIARRFAALGFSVIPVPRPRPGVPANTPGDGKTPAIKWKRYQTRPPADDELIAWFKWPANIAIITGAVSGVVVIDADTSDALQYCTRHLPYTPWQSHTSRGYHLFYRYPSVRVANRARLATNDGRLAIDVRGDGGFVIAPGSIHASGVEYLEAGDWTAPRDDVPIFKPKWIARPANPPSAPTPASRQPRLTGAVVDRARRYLAKIPPPVIGEGSDAAIFTIACRLVRGFALNAADAEALLWEWAGNRPGWTRDWIVAKVAHADQYGTEPVGGLR